MSDEEFQEFYGGVRVMTKAEILALEELAESLEKDSQVPVTTSHECSYWDGYDSGKR